MEEKASGIVVRTRPIGETSLIVHWLTGHAGRLATVAKGARRPKSPLAGKLDLFYSADFSFHRSARSELHTLREVSVTLSRPRLRTDFGALRQASYAIAFLEQTTEAETPLPEIFPIVEGFMDHLNSLPSRPRSVYAFELKMLAALGLDLDAVSETGKKEPLITELRDCPWQGLMALRPSADAVHRLRQRLHGFLIHHAHRLPRGREEALLGEE